MNTDNFNYAECKFSKRFLDSRVKAIHWKEYGSTEWYIVDPSVRPTTLKMTYLERKIVKLMLKLELLIPEIESDEEYKMQRALGVVIGRIYYMPEKVREEFKNKMIDI